MRTIDLLLSADWMLPIEPVHEVLSDHAIAIHEGKIVEILPRKIALEKYTADQTIHRAEHVLMPGFVNSHTHIGMNLLRGYADDLALTDWLENHIWPMEAKWVDYDFVYNASRLAIAEMIRSGTTCFNDTYFFPNATADALESTGMRANLNLILMEFKNNWANDVTDYFNKAMDFYNKYNKKAMLTFSTTAHATFTCSTQTLLLLKEMTEQLNVRMSMHVQEPFTEIDIIQKRAGKRPLAYLQELGLLSDRFIAYHMLHTNEEDIQILKDTQTQVVHCPESNMKLASGVCHPQQLLDAGINVALGTDGVVSNNDLDMIGEMRSAAFLDKVTSNNPEATTAKTVIKMATLNGAQALGLEKEIGSLCPGKQADIISINLSEIESHPLFNVISQIVYATTRQQVSDVWVAGKQLLNQRQLTTMDAAEIIQKAKSWRQKIKD